MSKQKNKNIKKKSVSSKGKKQKKQYSTEKYLKTTGVVLLLLIILTTIIVCTYSGEKGFTRKEIKEIKSCERYVEYESLLERTNEHYAMRTEDLIDEVKTELEDFPEMNDDPYHISMIVEMRAEEYDHMYEMSVDELKNMTEYNEDSGLIYKYWDAKLLELSESYKNDFIDLFTDRYNLKSEDMKYTP